ncbi:MAG TPA: hypothetical protein VMW25_04520 [Clostridia bacterium]|nr:hypothetical protein [Clostridia bacterium]
MATMHFTDYPLDRTIYSLTEDDVKGRKFKNWQKNANYTIRATVILQVNATRISAEEYAISPSISMVAANLYRASLYKFWARNNVSFPGLRRYYETRETYFERYVLQLMGKLNAARASYGYSSRWFVNTSLNSREIRVSQRLPAQIKWSRARREREIRETDAQTKWKKKSAEPKEKPAFTKWQKGRQKKEYKKGDAHTKWKG